MLILSRKLGEQIYIGTDIIVEVVEIRGGTVRLGFEAPQCVNIARAELKEPKERGRGHDAKPA